MKKRKEEKTEKCNYFIKGFYAGVMIAIGAITFLSVENKMLGSFLFSFGLLTVCMYEMNLYTGKIGYVLTNKKTFLKEVFIGLLGNIIGAICCGKIATLTRNKTIIDTARNITNIKLNDNILSILVLSFFCGIMIYLAVNNYKKSNNEIGKYIGIFMAVMIFILCGFEHCIANVAYFTIASNWSIKTILYVLIMILGNSLGSIFIAYFYNLFNKN